MEGPSSLERLNIFHLIPVKECPLCARYRRQGLWRRGRPDSAPQDLGAVCRHFLLLWFLIFINIFSVACFAYLISHWQDDKLKKGWAN